MFKEFKTFIMRGNVVDLAVAVIIGAAFGAIVKSLVDDIVMPPIGLLLGSVDFSSLYATLKAGPHAAAGYASLDAAIKDGAVILKYGQFINTVVNFLIVSFAVFFVIRQLNRFKKEDAAPAPVAPETSEEVLLLREIRDALANKN